MATKNTDARALRHEIGHAALSLISSIALAPIPVADALGRIHTIAALLDPNDVEDFDTLRGHIEDILRNHANSPTMENVVRHCHELRRKIREYQRINARGT